MVNGKLSMVNVKKTNHELVEYKEPRQPKAKK
jgi:hypothetical protein